MSVERGTEGERVSEQLLRYAGWTILERQAHVRGHTLDFRAKHADFGEALIEVKVWSSPGSGRDTVKKAIADAADLRWAGETRPYILILSHDLTGLHRDMLLRAMDEDVITQVLVLTLMPFAPGTVFS